jgi:hypothetical protein
MFTIPLLVTGGVVAGAASLATTRLSRNDAIKLQASQAELGILRVLQTVYPAIENYKDDTTLASNLRGCILIFDDKGGRIAYAHGDYSTLERSLIWRAGDGPIGMAFSKNQMVRAPEDVPLPSDISDIYDDPIKWKLTDDQRRAIAGKIATASAFPMADRKGVVHAVLLLEDSRPPDKSDLRRPGIQTRLKERVADPIRSQLAMTDFEFPGGYQQEADQ